MDFIIRPAGIGIGIRTCSCGSPHQTKNGGLRRAGVSIETGTRTETGSGGSHTLGSKAESGLGTAIVCCPSRKTPRLEPAAKTRIASVARHSANYGKFRRRQPAFAHTEKNPAADSELQRDISARQEFPVPICGKQAFRRRQGVRLTKSSRPRTPAACPPEP